MNLRYADKVGTVLGVVIVEIRLVLEVVGIKIALGQGNIRLHIVGELGDFERPTLLGQKIFNLVEDLA